VQQTTSVTREIFTAHLSHTLKRSQSQVVWQEATDKELQHISDSKAMLPIKLEEVPEGANITKSKIVYKLKLLPNGEIENI